MGKRSPSAVVRKESVFVDHVGTRRRIVVIAGAVLSALMLGWLGIVLVVASGGWSS